MPWKIFQRLCSSNCDESTRDDRGVRLPLRQKLFYGVGHVFNDLCANCWLSYLLLYMTKVVSLSNANAGLVLLIGQVFDAIFAASIGYVCDKTNVKCYGRRKLWHLIGTCCVLLSFPFIFNLCINCENTSTTILLVYYSGFVIVFQFGGASVQISHLSLIPEIARKTSEKVELNAIRSGLRYVSGIYVFVVAWLLLGSNPEESVNRSLAPQFMQLLFIVVGTGFAFSLVFHFGTKEPRNYGKVMKITDSTSIENYLKETVVNHNALEKDMVELESNNESVNHKSANRESICEEPVNHEPTSHESVNHKSINHEPVNHESVNHEPVNHESVNHEPVNHESICEEPVNHEPTSHESVNHESINHESVNHESISHETVNHKSMNHESIGDEPVNHESISDESVNHKSCNHESVNHKSCNHESVNHKSVNRESICDESINHKSVNHEPVNHKSVNRESICDESVNHKSINHEPVNHESVNHETVNHESICEEPVTHEPTSHESVNHESINHKPVNHEPVNHKSVNRESICDESVNHKSINHESVNHESISHETVNHKSMNHESIGDEPVNHESISDELILNARSGDSEAANNFSAVGRADEVNGDVFTNDINLIQPSNCNKEEECKNWKEWFKSSFFYRMAVVYMCTRLTLNVSQAYFVLYLTETMHFEKEAIAYFPLLVLICGAFTSILVKPLTKRIGFKFTFIIGCLCALTSFVWLFFVNKDARKSVYVAAILMGSGCSIMLITSLAMTADLIGSHKGSGAFVYSAMVFTDKLSSGIVIYVIQQLKPSEESGTFTRYVQSIVTGVPCILALACVAIFFPSDYSKKPMNCPANGGGEILVNEANYNKAMEI